MKVSCHKKPKAYLNVCNKFGLSGFKYSHYLCCHLYIYACSIEFCLKQCKTEYINICTHFMFPLERIFLMSCQISVLGFYVSKMVVGICLSIICSSICIIVLMGPVVQSIISLTKLLVKSTNCKNQSFPYLLRQKKWQCFLHKIHFKF